MNADTKTIRNTVSSQPEAGKRIQARLHRWFKPHHTKTNTEVESVSADTVYAWRIAMALRHEAFQITYAPQQRLNEIQLNTRRFMIACSVMLVIACVLAGIAGSFAALMLSYLQDVIATSR